MTGLQFINSTYEFLQGKKTYIVGTFMIIIGLNQQNSDLILQGFGLITLRAGISKSTL